MFTKFTEVYVAALVACIGYVDDQLYVVGDAATAKQVHGWAQRWVRRESAEWMAYFAPNLPAEMLRDNRGPLIYDVLKHYEKRLNLDVPAYYANTPGW